MTFGERIQQLRVERHLSQSEVAQTLNVPWQTVDAWEIDVSTPDSVALRKLETLYGVSLLGLVDTSMADRVRELKAGQEHKEAAAKEYRSVYLMRSILMVVSWFATGIRLPADWILLSCGLLVHTPLMRIVILVVEALNLAFGVLWISGGANWLKGLMTLVASLPVLIAMLSGKMHTYFGD